MNRDTREDAGQYYPGGTVIPKTPTSSGGGEPSAYIRDAAVANEKLTLTKKDGTTTVELDVSGKITNPSGGSTGNVLAIGSGGDPAWTEALSVSTVYASFVSAGDMTPTRINGQAVSDKTFLFSGEAVAEPTTAGTAGNYLQKTASGNAWTNVQAVYNSAGTQYISGDKVVHPLNFTIAVDASAEVAFTGSTASVAWNSANSTWDLGGVISGYGYYRSTGCFDRDSTSVLFIIYADTDPSTSIGSVTASRPIETLVTSASAPGVTAVKADANGNLNLSTLFSSANTSLVSTTRYTIGSTAVVSGGTLVDREINNFTMAATEATLTMPTRDANHARDFIIRVTCPASQTVGGIAFDGVDEWEGDALDFTAGSNYLVSCTETAYDATDGATWLIKVLELETKS